MLAYRIKKNNVRIRISTLFSVFLSENLTSFLNVCVRFFLILLNEFCKYQVFVTVSGINIKKIVHDKESVDVLGSNDENRFVIICWVFLSF